MPGGHRSRRAAAASVLGSAALALSLLVAGPASGAAKPSKERFGVIEHTNLPIVMSDGTVLRANVTLPADPATGEPARGRFPVVLTETAYGKDIARVAGDFSSLLGNPTYFARRGYVGVMVDVRGTGASEGTWSFNDPQEARDSVEVIRWAAKLPHSNGRVGMVGASYLGITQLFAAAEVGRRSPLKAIFPMIASNSIFREAVMPGGLLDSEGVALYLGLTAVLNLVNPVAGAGNPGALLKPVADHLAGLLSFHAGASLDALTGGPRAEDGPFWRARAPERILHRIVRNRIPAFLVGGLDDLFQSGVFRNYVGLQNAWAGRRTTRKMSRAQRATGRYQALVGPWFHAVIGTGGPDLNALALRWMDRWLKGVRNGIERTRRPLRVIERDRTTRRFARWPIPRSQVRTYGLAPGGALERGAVSVTRRVPLVFTGISGPCQRSTEQWALGLGEAILGAFGLPEPCADGSLQPPLPAPATRSFTTPPLSKPLTMAGPITAEVRLTSTTEDAEVIAKLYDVAPSGVARELTMGGLLASHRAIKRRLSWRAGGRTIYPHHPITHAARRPLSPGEPTTLAVEIAPTVHTLRPGHRLRLVLATGEFPARFPLPGDLVNLLGGIYGVELGGESGSRLILPVLASRRAPRAGGR